jgi:Tol biopolymer transport system component
MNMRRISTILLSLIAGTALAVTSLHAQLSEAEKLYQAGIYQLEAVGNFDQAITIFNRVVKEYAANKTIAGKSLLKLGLCYERLGSQKASEAYEQILKQYADQPDLVSQARIRLAALSALAENGHGLLARRVLTKDDIEIDNLILMKPSQDGKRVVFMDDNCGIFLRELATKKTEKLVDGLPSDWNTSPLFSPDGNRVAFLSGTDGDSKLSLRMMDLTTRELTTLPGTEGPVSAESQLTIRPVDWTRDGRFLLLAPVTLGGDRRGSLAIMPTSGGVISVLAEKTTGEGSFSPDGRYVTFAMGEKGNEQIFILPTAGGERTQITTAEGGNTTPLWSPDGQSIAFLRPDGIWLMHVSDGNVAGIPQLIYASSIAITLQTWTEAGELYFTLYNEEKIPYQLAVDASTGALTVSVAPLPYYPKAEAPFKWAWYPSEFAWSPDGKQIAFLGWSNHLVVYSENGTKVNSHQVLENREYAHGLGWSKDGKEIRYVSFLARRGGMFGVNPVTGEVHEMSSRSLTPVMLSQSDDGRYRLYRHFSRDATGGLEVTETGSPVGRLLVPGTDAEGVSLGYNSYERISPRGDRVLFARQADRDVPDAGALWVIGTDGKGLKKLGMLRTINGYVWDPSSRLVAYTGVSGNKKEVLRVVDLETGAERNIPLPAGASNFRVTSWSRDGKHIGLVANQSRWEYLAVTGIQRGTAK